MADSDDEYGSLDYRNIERISLGRYEFDTWFGNSALFLPNEPELLAYKAIDQGIKRTSSHRKVIEYTSEKRVWLSKLHVCPFCFKYSDDPHDIERHLINCKYRTKKPGKVVYFDDQVTIRKVRGAKHKLFCQCFCLLAKFYLDNKSVFYNLVNYDFYVIYGVLDGETVPMGFYSREVLSWDENNLSCIFVVPCYQKRHLGTKLVDFSYCLSNYQRLISGPERPLSELGRVTYLRYWCGRLSVLLLYGPLAGLRTITLQLLIEKTGFRYDDILMALDYLKAFYERGSKAAYSDYYSDPTGDAAEDTVILWDKNYRLFLDKSKLKKWVIDHHVKDKPVLNPNGLSLY